MDTLVVVLLLGALILVHEAGHLAVGRLVRIPIAEFSVGFGPKLWSRVWKGTEYSLRALPLGGFVLPAAASAAEFRAIALRKRLAFFVGGPLANLAAAVPLFGALNALDRGLSLHNLVLAPLGQAAKACWQSPSLLLAMLTDPGSLSGVIGIVVEGGRLAEAGMVLELAISLSISLAILNLLPIPVLDGGQLLLACLEAVSPRVARLRTAATLLGVAIVASVTIYANVQDAFRYWGIGSP